jgi:hypothetical protein
MVLITLPVYKTIDIEEYVDVSIDPYRFTVERQFINPFFVEIGLFKNIDSIRQENSDITYSVEEESEKYDIRINK